MLSWSILLKSCVISRNSLLQLNGSRFIFLIEFIEMKTLQMLDISHKMSDCERFTWHNTQAIEGQNGAVYRLYHTDIIHCECVVFSSKRRSL